MLSGIEGDALTRSIEWLLRIWVAIVRWPLCGPRSMYVHSVESTAPGTISSGAVHNAIDLSAAPGSRAPMFPLRQSTNDAGHDDGNDGPDHLQGKVSERTLVFYYRGPKLEAIWRD